MATDGSNDDQAAARRVIEQMNAADRRLTDQRQQAIRREQVAVDRMWRDVVAGKPFDLPPRAIDQGAIDQPQDEVPSGVS